VFCTITISLRVSQYSAKSSFTRPSANLISVGLLSLLVQTRQDSKMCSTDWKPWVCS